MKFGKQIQQSTLAEWSAHYMSYKTLKRLIKAAVAERQQARGTALRTTAPNISSSSSTSSTSISSSTPSTMATGIRTATGISTGETREEEEEEEEEGGFFRQLDLELAKVNKFYLQRERELKARLDFLQEKKSLLSCRDHPTTEALTTIRQAFVQFQFELVKLQQFVEVNATGFRKILKKYDKRMKATTKELYLSSQVNIQPCFNKDVLAELSNVAAKHLSDLDFVIRESAKDGRIAFERLVFQNDHTQLESDILRCVSTNDAPGLAVGLESLQKQHAQQGKLEDVLREAMGKACSSGGSAEVVRMLLEHGAEVSAVDDFSGRTYLHEAAMSGNDAALGVLIDFLHTRKKRPKNEADSNSSHQNEDHRQLFGLPDIYGRSALHYAAMQGCAECAKLLLGDYACVEADYDGMTPLMYAIVRGHVGCVSVLLTSKEITETSGLYDDVLLNGRSPLGLACQHGHEQIARILIEKHANINCKSLWDLTPLHLACREGHAACCKLLVDHGADVAAVDKIHQWTPLFYASVDGYTEIVKILLSVPSTEKYIRDEGGWTPWQYALYRGHMEAAGLLKLPSVPLPSLAPSKANGPQSVMGDISIPTLELPPPMIPVKVFGHHHIEKHHHQLQVRLGMVNVPPAQRRAPLRLTDPGLSTSVKVVISPMDANAGGGEITRMVNLPLLDEQEVFKFNVKELAKFGLSFDIFPAFGTKKMGRAVVLSDFLFCEDRDAGSGTLPIFDTYLEVVGELTFEYVVIHPFADSSLSSKHDVPTYWKSTTSVSLDATWGSPPVLSKGNFSALAIQESFKLRREAVIVTDSSLSDSYRLVKIALTKDKVPVVYSQWFLHSLIGFDVEISDITYEEFRRIPPDPVDQLHGLFPRDRNVSLRELLEGTKADVGYCLELSHPSYLPDDVEFLARKSFSYNDVVDSVLHCIYECNNNRNLMFCSESPNVCLMLNLKQPNYPVLLRTYAGLKKRSEPRCNSLQQAVRFAKSHSLFGLVCEATPLVEIPALRKLVKSEGLILASFGDEGHLQTLRQLGEVDILVDHAGQMMHLTGPSTR